MKDADHIADVSKKVDEVIDFIRSKRISMYKLEEKLRIPHGTLSRAINGGQLPVKHVRALIIELKKYGFN